MSDFIPLCVPFLDEDDAKAVSDVVSSGWVSSAGAEIIQFENALCHRFSYGFATACTSGTAALHLALTVAGIGNGHEVIIPDITFVATANAVRHANAQPVIVDIDPKTLGMCPQSVAMFLETHCEVKDGVAYNKRTGNIVSCLMPVHMLGTPADMTKLLRLAKKFGLKVIEDATEAMGSLYRGNPAGTMGDAGCFSFNGNKMITTGGGGLVVSGSEKLVHKAKHLASTAKVDDISFFHDQVGYNYRLTNLQAALGVSQLRKFDKIFEAKQKIHSIYSQMLEDHPSLSLFEPPTYVESNHWLNLVSMNERITSRYSLLEVISLMQKKNIQIRPLWTRISELPMFKNCAQVDLHFSKILYSSSFCVPSSANLEDSSIEQIVFALSEL